MLPRSLASRRATSHKLTMPLGNLYTRLPGGALVTPDQAGHVVCSEEDMHINQWCRPSTERLFQRALASVRGSRSALAPSPVAMQSGSGSRLMGQTKLR
eukprot:826291-Prymnesium_polylepis.1